MVKVYINAVDNSIDIVGSSFMLPRYVDTIDCTRTIIMSDIIERIPSLNERLTDPQNVNDSFTITTVKNDATIRIIPRIIVKNISVICKY